jgi:hypothetical protein
VAALPGSGSRAPSTVLSCVFVAPVFAIVKTVKTVKTVKGVKARKAGGVAA